MIMRGDNYGCRIINEGMIEIDHMDGVRIHNKKKTDIGSDPHQL